MERHCLIFKEQDLTRLKEWFKALASSDGELHELDIELCAAIATLTDEALAQLKELIPTLIVAPIAECPI